MFIEDESILHFQNEFPKHLTHCMALKKALRNNVALGFKWREGRIYSTLFSLGFVIYYLYKFEQVWTSVSFPVEWEWEYTFHRMLWEINDMMNMESISG